MVKSIEKGLDITIYIKTHFEGSASIFNLIYLDIEVLVYSCREAK